MSFRWIARIFVIIGAICYFEDEVIRGAFFFGTALFYMLESINERLK